MYCRKCGAEVKNNGRFCPSCGAEVKRSNNLNQPKQHQEIVVKSQVIENDYQNPVSDKGDMDKVMGVFSYVGLFWLSSIPIIGIVLIIIWAMNSSNKNKTNYCRAIIVNWLIAVVLVIIFWGSLGSLVYYLM